MQRADERVSARVGSDVHGVRAPRVDAIQTPQVALLEADAVRLVVRVAQRQRRAGEHGDPLGTERAADGAHLALDRATLDRRLAARWGVRRLRPQDGDDADTEQDESETEEEAPHASGMPTGVRSRAQAVATAQIRRGPGAFACGSVPGAPAGCGSVRSWT